MQQYVTNDYYLSAYLVTMGFGFHHFERDGGITSFIFEKSDQVDDLVKLYYGFQAKVNPISYGNAMRSLKTIIQAGKNHAINESQEQQRKGN